MVKSINEINIYFHDFTSNDLSELNYLIAVISTINPEATKNIVEEARIKRSICSTDDIDNLIEVNPEFKEEFRKRNP